MSPQCNVDSRNKQNQEDPSSRLHWHKFLQGNKL